jgi:hypothetical protein
MRIRYINRGEIVETKDVNTTEPVGAKGVAIVRLGMLRQKRKADRWEIVDELGTIIARSED